MDVIQIYLPRMENFAYLAADPASMTCAVIDPAFDPEKILKEARKLGYRITHVINTHGHMDHTAGNAAIIEQTGATLCIHQADADAVSKFFNRTVSRLLGGKGSPPPGLLLTDNDRIPIGQSALQVIHTPGHTLGSICLYTPGHIFTGDTLFVGAVGRTDLAGGSHRQLIESVKNRIYTLAGDTIVWPGHDYGDTPSSTVDIQRRENPFTL